MSCIYFLTFFLLGGPTSFSFYAIVVTLNKIFNSIPNKTLNPYTSVFFSTAIANCVSPQEKDASFLQFSSHYPQVTCKQPRNLLAVTSHLFFNLLTFTLQLSQIFFSIYSHFSQGNYRNGRAQSCI